MISLTLGLKAGKLKSNGQTLAISIKAVYFNFDQNQQLQKGQLTSLSNKSIKLNILNNFQLVFTNCC